MKVVLLGHPDMACFTIEQEHDPGNYALIWPANRPIPEGYFVLDVQSGSTAEGP